MKPYKKTTGNCATESKKQFTRLMSIGIDLAFHIYTLHLHSFTFLTKTFETYSKIDSKTKELSLKRGFGECGHGFGGRGRFCGLGGFSRFDGFGGFGGFVF